MGQGNGFWGSAASQEDDGVFLPRSGRNQQQTDHPEDDIELPYIENFAAFCSEIYEKHVVLSKHSQRWAEVVSTPDSEESQLVMHEDFTAPATLHAPIPVTELRYTGLTARGGYLFNNVSEAFAVPGYCALTNTQDPYDVKRFEGRSQRLVCASYDESLMAISDKSSYKYGKEVIRLKDGQSLGFKQSVHVISKNHIAFFPQSIRGAVNYGIIMVQHLHTDRRILELESQHMRCCFDPNERHIATADFDGDTNLVLRQYSLEDATLELEQKISPSSGLLRLGGIDYSESGRYLILSCASDFSESNRGMLYIFDRVNQLHVDCIHEYAGKITSMHIHEHTGGCELLLTFENIPGITLVSADMVIERCQQTGWCAEADDEKVEFLFSMPHIFFGAKVDAYPLEFPISKALCLPNAEFS